MQKPISPLANYGNPPVVEVVFGIQFNELSELTAPLRGILWEKIGRGKYPKYEERPPLARVVERFDGPPFKQREPELEAIAGLPSPRSFFINSTGNHLIQVQQDRFLQNWRKQKPENQYPRYVELFPEFTNAWNCFAEFVTDEKVGNLEPNQYELTYLNHIPREAGWKNLTDIEKVFPDFICRANDPFLPEPENIGWRRVYRLPNEKGRLHVTLNQAFSTETNDLVLVLNITARGFDKNGMNSWFDMAHEWIVRSFDDLTSEEMQNTIWKKR